MCFIVSKNRFIFWAYNALFKVNKFCRGIAAKLQFNCFTTCLLDRLDSRSGEPMSLNFNRRSNFTTVKDLNQVILRAETIFTNQIQRYYRSAGFLNQCLDCIQVQRLVFNAVDVIETEFRQTSLKRHLTTFEAQLAAVT